MESAKGDNVADGDAPEKMICRIPAWLYYKAGLDKFFPVERRSQALIFEDACGARI